MMANNKVFPYFHGPSPNSGFCFQSSNSRCTQPLLGLRVILSAQPDSPRSSAILLAGETEVLCQDRGRKFELKQIQQLLLAKRYCLKEDPVTPKKFYLPSHKNWESNVITSHQQYRSFYCTSAATVPSQHY